MANTTKNREQVVTHDNVVGRDVPKDAEWQRRLFESLPDPNIRANALKVLQARYLIKDDKGKSVEAPKQLYWRVAMTIANAERSFPGCTEERVEFWAKRFYELMADGTYMPNSPTLMNAGREMGMLSACFVLPVEDSIEGIFSSIKATALIQKAGGGTGFDFSRLRPSGDVVKSSGGTTEGPLSFIQVFSAATNAIQQGAFRRGANMGMLRVDHPDVLGFVTIKDDLSKLTNYNISISVTDEYINQLRADQNAPHRVMNPRSGEWRVLSRPDGTVVTVGELWNLIIDHAWRSGEPGVIFIDRINATNPTLHIGRMEATNPCGEQPLLPFEACNLGSINVAKFVKRENGRGKLDEKAFRKVVRECVRFLDNVVEVNNYPLTEIREMCLGNRKIGLGVMGFADALYEMGLSYCSDEGVKFGEDVMRILNDESHDSSEALAEERGSFPFWPGSSWQQNGRKMRNACSTTVAPTGTISIIAGCSGGIEPLFSLAFFRQVLDGQRLTEVHDAFMRVANERDFYNNELIERIAAEGSIQHFEEIPEDVRKVYVCAHDVTPDWHMRMQAAFQKHCDASISKTINFPNEASVEDVRAIYEMAIDLNVKGVTVYRDGCRDRQPMALSTTKRPGSNETQIGGGESAAAAGVAEATEIRPVRLPEIMPSLRIRQMTPFGNMHVKISVDPKTDREREVFAQLGKGGDIANSDLEAICRMISLFLRCNGSLEMVVNQLDGIGSSLSIPSRDGRILSLADGLAKALTRYLAAKKKYTLRALLLGEVSAEELVQLSEAPASRAHAETARTAFKVKCPQCSFDLSFQEGCVKCHSCGFSQC
ncbi:MAG: vitamin B12-dependent ribonucleotide reductase [Planctomycetes bacterium]|nr:vitamin B12-dependent ribonucleotide reductase [Planctomycetota bacterium]